MEESMGGRRKIENELDLLDREIADLRELIDALREAQAEAQTLLDQKVSRQNEVKGYRYAEPPKPTDEE